MQVNGNFSTTDPNGTYQLSLTGMAGTNGQPVNFSGLPYSGATVTIATATLTPTSSPTITSTATPQATIIVYPNPVTGPGPVTLQFTLVESANRVEVLVFTLAFRKVNEIVLSNVSAGTTDVALPLTDKEGRPLANGIYYVLVITPQGRSIGKLLVLR